MRESPGLRQRHTTLYSFVAAAILIWAAAIVYAAIAITQVDFYLISYYVADYTFGFVRRGLAGEIVGTVSGESYLRNALAMRWLSTGLYLGGLGALALTIWSRGKAERKTMLALLIPVLPFGVPYAVFSARPDLFGATALIALSLTLAVVKKPASASLSCGLYGVLAAALVFIHEGIGFEFALGAILAILVLRKDLAQRTKNLCIALAVAPALVAVVVVAAFARHDISTKLCSIVPHLRIQTPFGTFTTASKFIDDVFANRQSSLDYHDWVCKNYLPAYDYSTVEGIKVVLAVGAPGLAASFLLGLFVIAVSVWAVHYFSGASFASFVGELGGRFGWAIFGIVLMVPVFLTGFDWTRWLLVIAFNIVVPYVLYAVRRPEIDEAPTRRAVQLFVLVVVLFALVPLGLVPGGPVG